MYVIDPVALVALITVCWCWWIFCVESLADRSSCRHVCGCLTHSNQQQPGDVQVIPDFLLYTNPNCEEFCTRVVVRTGRVMQVLWDYGTTVECALRKKMRNFSAHIFHECAVDSVP